MNGKHVGKRLISKKEFDPSGNFHHKVIRTLRLLKSSQKPSRVGHVAAVRYGLTRSTERSLQLIHTFMTCWFQQICCHCSNSLPRDEFQCICLSQQKAISTTKGFEPSIFWSEVRRLILQATWLRLAGRITTSSERCLPLTHKSRNCWSEQMNSHCSTIS